MTAPVERCLAVVFADIAGSTGIYESLGDRDGHALVSRCLELLEEETYMHRGTVIKTIGDELMCTFPDMISAVAAATGMQQQAMTVKRAGGATLQMRIGMHYGQALEERGDVFGDAVNVAARVVEFAKAGQILLTQECVAVLPPLGRRKLRMLDTLSVKGKSTELTIHEVLWRRSALMTTYVPVIPAASPAGQGLLTLHYGNSRMSVQQGVLPFVIGRDPTSNLVVNAVTASRQHALIEWRRGKFVLVDLSTNGTFVTPEGEPEVFLKREEYVLRGTGAIGCGERVGAVPAAVVRFECRLADAA